MNHCLAQVFRAGLPLRLPNHDFMSRSIVLKNPGMIHRDIRGPLFKVTYRIAPCGHHIAQQLVRFRYRTGRAVNETRLDCAPSLRETRTIACREGSDVKCLDSLGALLE